MSEKEQIDYCILCDGVQGPDHVHICANCGVKVELAQLLSFGNDAEPRRIYCSLFCHITAEPDGAYAQGMTAEAKNRMMRREELNFKMRELKRQCIEEGVPWIH